jgi:hypothetical protein
MPEHNHNRCIVDKTANPENHERCKGPPLFSSKKQVETKEQVANPRVPHLPKLVKSRFSPTPNQRSLQNGPSTGFWIISSQRKIFSITLPICVGWHASSSRLDCWPIYIILSSLNWKDREVLFYSSFFLIQWVRPKANNPITLAAAKINVAGLPQSNANSFIKSPRVPIIKRRKGINSITVFMAISPPALVA